MPIDTKNDLKRRKILIKELEKKGIKVDICNLLKHRDQMLIE
jgi:hypothetical protein